MGAVSMVCLLVALILLMHLIQQAFARSGVIWGVVAAVYPPGTYIYCRKNWDNYRGRFLLITTLLCVFLIFWVIAKIAQMF